MEDQKTQNKPFSFVDTTATKKIMKLRKRIRAVKGGTSASKTISILVWLINYCQVKHESPQICTVASESFPHLSAGAIRDFKNIMIDRGYWKDKLWNATKSFYTFETGNTLEFTSVDTYGKAHGPRRDVLFLNECPYLSWEIVDQLIIRTRKIIWLDWNPSEQFWFHEQILPYRDDLDYITLTYKDNEALDTETVKEIESHKHNTQWWTVYGLGQDGATEARIYDNWIILDEIPKEARLVRKGLDFGYTNDPTALYDIYIWNNALIFDEILYQKGLVNSEIAKVIGKDQPLTVGDSAEPKSIREIAMHGVSIIGATKGKGSITHGIDAVKSKQCYITKRSINGIREYRSYCWEKDINGNFSKKPMYFNNHAMDAIRYAVSNLIPEAEPADAYVPETNYDTPAIGSSKLTTERFEPIITIGNTPSKGRLAYLQEKKRLEHENQSYETETPWQKPGI